MKWIVQKCWTFACDETFFGLETIDFYWINIEFTSNLHRTSSNFHQIFTVLHRTFIKLHRVFIGFPSICLQIFTFSHSKLDQASSSHKFRLQVIHQIVFRCTKTPQNSRYFLHIISYHFIALLQQQILWFCLETFFPFRKTSFSVQNSFIRRKEEREKSS